MDMVREAYEALRERVLALREAGTGAWTGELSSSALGTALAVSALGAGGRPDRALAEAGADWLIANANSDGAWGDTPDSVSNLSTTLIVRAALSHHRSRMGAEACLSASGAWVLERTGSVAFEAYARALRDIYGSDRTFAVPILAYVAMCGEDDRAWPSVPPLPFLLALLPQGLYRFFRLQVVSYALPALIAVGLCRHVRAARVRGRLAWGRWFAGPLLRRLAALQPEHGGFLDAIPLTAFVALALRHAGYGEHPVAQKGLAFLRQAARRDGSWAIDSNLRTWVTSLAVRAVWSKGVPAKPETRNWKLEAGGIDDAERVAKWFVKAQLKVRHPFTGARPGGWAWTDLPGGVPDADDTCGALLALRRLKDAESKTDISGTVRGGVRWLLELQNADGGMPTFCRGWGRLPFDRSCPDLSAHALAALAAWHDVSPRIAKAMERLARFLEKAQAKDGSWLPLWFGHQDAEGCRNPVVGTARVVDALRDTCVAWREARGQRPEDCETVVKMLARGEAWLMARQREDGGWSAGQAPTVEETALAVIALTDGGPACEESARRGCAWLVANWEAGAAKPAPIGLYFALLWYHEKMYPLVWACEALGRNVNRARSQ